MEIRKATANDIKTLSYKLRAKKIDYNTVEMMKADVRNNNLYILIDNNEIISSCAVVPTEFRWLGIKRLVTYSKKYRGKGYAKKLLTAVTSDDREYCITPWNDNEPMKKMVASIGFKYKYTFNEKWLCYIKNEKIA